MNDLSSLLANNKTKQERFKETDSLLVVLEGILSCPLLGSTSHAAGLWSLIGNLFFWGPNERGIVACESFSALDANYSVSKAQLPGGEAGAVVHRAQQLLILKIWLRATTTHCYHEQELLCLLHETAPLVLLVEVHRGQWTRWLSGRQ